MTVTRHQTTIDTDLLGKVSLCFIATGKTENPDFRLTDAWVDVTESGTVTLLNAELTRTAYARTRPVDLPRELFDGMRLTAWDAMLDQMQRDRDPSVNSERIEVDEPAAVPNSFTQAAE